MTSIITAAIVSALVLAAAPAHACWGIISQGRELNGLDPNGVAQQIERPADAASLTLGLRVVHAELPARTADETRQQSRDGSEQGTFKVACSDE